MYVFKISVPVAWKIVKATKKGSWKPHWLKLVEKLQDGDPIVNEQKTTPDVVRFVPDEIGYNPYKSGFLGQPR